MYMLSHSKGDFNIMESFVGRTKLNLKEEIVEFLMLWFICQSEYIKQEAFPSIAQTLFPALGLCLAPGPSQSPEMTSLSFLPFQSLYLTSHFSFLPNSVSLEVDFSFCNPLSFCALL